jgi:large subunit ribosomal protein L25
MKEITLEAIVRTESGKGSARRTRRDGRIPAITYGPEMDPTSMAIDDRQFRAAMRAGSSGSTIFNLNIDGTARKVILREIQRDPVTSDIIHLDFQAISMNKPIHVSIPVQYIGTPEGVKTDGGIMQITMREVEISVLPAHLPESIKVDVSALRIGESIHISDISVPEATIIAEGQRTMVVISAPTVVKSATAGAEGEETEAGAEAAPAEGAEGGDEKKAKEEE